MTRRNTGPDPGAEPWLIQTAGRHALPLRLVAHCQVMAIGWLEAISQVRYRRAGSLLGLLMTPIAVAAGAVAAWRFGVDAGWTSKFFIAGGLLSHWQVWCAFAISAETGSYLLIRTNPIGVRATS
jgi:hypothetical protein